MRLNASFAFLAFISQSLTVFTAPIELAKTSEALVARDLGDYGILEARELLLDLDTREQGESDDLESALRSLSDDDLLALEARGLKGIAKLAKAAVSPIKKLTSAIRPSSRKAPSPAPAAKKPKAAAKAPASKKSAPNKSSGKSGKSSSASSKKGSKARKAAASGKGTSSKGSGKKGVAKGNGSGKKASASGSKGDKSNKKGGKGKGKGKSGGKKGKKSDKKGNTPSRTRNRTFNVNLDPGTLLNAGAAIANVVTGLVN